MKLSFFTLLGLSLFVQGCATTMTAEKQALLKEKLVSLSLDGAIEKISITDNKFNSSVIYSSLDVFNERKETSNIMKNINPQIYLSGAKDKITGEFSVFVVALMEYNDVNWHHYNSATYLSPDGKPVSVNVNSIDTDVNCSRYSCAYREELLFQVPIKDLSYFRNAKSPEESFRFRIGAKKTKAFEYGFVASEIDALMIKMGYK